MNKTILFFILFSVFQNFLFSQSNFSLGIGLGHQFGTPGIRANYMYRKIETSANFGWFLFSPLTAGCGFSLLIPNKQVKESGNKEYVTYNLGIIFLKEKTLRNIHTFSINGDYKLSGEKVRMRVGVGLSYIPTDESSTFMNKRFYPSFSYGLMYSLWDSNFKNKVNS
jgi:hypothetical protein